MAGYDSDSWYGGPNSSPFPRSSGDVGSAAAQAKAAGWKNVWGDVWTSPAHPGQYLSSGDVVARMGKQTAAAALMNPTGPGINYMSTVQPYLDQASSAISSGPKEVNTSNIYDQRLQQLLDNPDSISDTGAYKFRFNQGQQAVERSAAAKGMTGSGNVLAALSDYGAGQASQAYGDEATRLAGLAGTQNNYILGLKNAANNEFTARASGGTSLGSLALNAAKASSDDYWKQQQLKSDNTFKSNYVNQNIW